MKKFLRCLAAGVIAALGAFGLGACEDKKEDTVTVYAPDGAPALAIAGMMQDGFKVESGELSIEIDCRVVNPSLIATKVTAKDMEANADFCVLPLTAASKLLGSGENYQMLGAVTHGNLYLVSENEVSYTAENLTALIGKTVGVLQIKEVPGLVFKTVLEKNGVAWQEVTSDGEKSADKVNLLAISGAGDVGAIEADCFVLGEPAASAQAGKGFRIVGSLQELYGGQDGYPQAVLVGKRSLLVDEEWTAAFVREAVASAAWLNGASGEEIVSRVTANLDDQGYATTLKAGLLKTEVVSRCSVRFVSALDCRADVETFLTAAASVQPQMAVKPQEAFYCLRDFGL